MSHEDSNSTGHGLSVCHSVGCVLINVYCAAPAAECSGSYATCLSDQSCPVVDYMT